MRHLFSIANLRRSLQAWRRRASNIGDDSEMRGDRVRSARLACLLLAMTLGSAAAARDEPLWEAGIGVAGLHFPDYRGSERSRTYALPAPYFVYRGEFFKLDRHGLRGVLFETDRLDLNLSVGASLPVDSSANRVREGMPDLRPSVELGPSLYVTMWRSADRLVKVDARLPLRGAVTIESDPRYIGVQFFPHLNVDVRDPAGLAGWSLGVLVGPVLNDARYNRYYYQVAPAYATAARPAYTPGGGYAGMQFLFAASKRFPRYWIGGFARYDTLRGSVFESSPLVASKKYVAAGIGISWIVGESSQRVPAPDTGSPR